MPQMQLQTGSGIELKSQASPLVFVSCLPDLFQPLRRQDHERRWIGGDRRGARSRQQPRRLLLHSPAKPQLSSIGAQLTLDISRQNHAGAETGRNSRPRSTLICAFCCRPTGTRSIACQCQRSESRSHATLSGAALRYHKRPRETAISDHARVIVGHVGFCSIATAHRTKQPALRPASRRGLSARPSHCRPWIFLKTGGGRGLFPFAEISTCHGWHAPPSENLGFY